MHTAFIVSAGLRFVPRVATTFQELREAQEARGIRFTPIWQHMPTYLALLLPLLREVFRLIDQLALALESRGFSATPRTPLDKHRWHLIDVCVVIMSVAGCVSALFFGR